MRGTAPRDPANWRLPAPELEGKVADLVAAHMNRPSFRAGIPNDATTDDTVEVGKKLSSLKTKPAGAERVDRGACLALVDRIDNATGELRLAISAERLAELLGVDQARVAENLLSTTSAFQHRKRGIETRLIIGNEPADIDDTLLHNIGLANRYFDLVRAGNTFNEIADAEGVSKRRIQQLIELAFLAPDAIRSVREGRQPIGMTSDWLKRHAFPPVWSEQQNMFAAL